MYTQIYQDNVKKQYNFVGFRFAETLGASNRHCS